MPDSDDVSTFDTLTNLSQAGNSGESTSDGLFELDEVIVKGPWGRVLGR